MKWHIPDLHSFPTLSAFKSSDGRNPTNSLRGRLEKGCNETFKFQTACEENSVKRHGMGHLRFCAPSPYYGLSTDHYMAAAIQPAVFEEGNFEGRKMKLFEF